MTPIAAIPKNSLVGDAKFCLLSRLFEKLKNLLVDAWNFLANTDSALKALMTRKPPKVSSNMDKKYPCSF